MGFHDVYPPTVENLGSDGGPGFATSAIRLGSGQSRIILRNSVALSEFDLSYEAKTHTDISNLREFYLARKGSVHSFRYKSWSDYTSSSTGQHWTADGVPVDVRDQVISNGTSQTIQLTKTYQDAEGSYIKNIYLPVSGTVRVGVDDGLGGFTELVEGVDFSVSYTSGTILLTSAPTDISTVYAGYEYDHHVRFSPILDAEKFRQAIDTYGSGSVASLPIEEVAEGMPVRDMIDKGGQMPPQQVGVAGLPLSYAATLWPIEPTVSLPIIQLPPIEYADPTGGPWFILLNYSTQYSFQLHTYLGLFVRPIDPGRAAIVTSLKDANEDLFWIAMV